MSSPTDQQQHPSQLDGNDALEKSASGQQTQDNHASYINDQTDDDKKFSYSIVDRQESYSLDSIPEDSRMRQDFLNSDECSQFSELIVVSQVRKDRVMHMSEQENQLLYLIARALYKGVRNLLVKANKIADKEQWQKEYQKLMRLYYQDINVGYITSTGQIKSTSFIFISNPLVEYLHNKQIHLNFKKDELKFIASYFSFEQRGIRSVSEISSPVQSHFQRQFTEQNYEHSTPLVHEQYKSALTDKNEENAEIFHQKKQQLPLCHQSNWLKQAFIKRDYFKKTFLILQKSNEQELKLGITIYFVYRIADDQIYAVKRVFIQPMQSRLSSPVLSFYDMFSTVSITDMTQDQRKIREAKILSKLNHPNILTLYDWWIEEDVEGYSLYMMSEYCSVPGYKHQTHDLLNYAYYYLNPMGVREKIDQIKTIMLQIMDGLEYIHKRGIVHRDLKPENIFVTQTIRGELQVILADFDQGKDVRESKLSIITDEKIPEIELNSIKSKNTIKIGTTGYTTATSQINKEYDKMDEFYALGVTLLHLILAFPGEPKNRNLYASTFGMSDVSHVLALFDDWANKLVRNKHKDFVFSNFLPQLDLAKKLLDKKLREHDHIRAKVQSW